MTLSKFNQADYRPVSFNSFLDKFFNENTPAETGGVRFSPSVDILEDDQSFEIQLAIPGLKKDEFNIELDEKTLTVKGERKFTTEKKEKNYHAVGTQYGSFSRTFHLPVTVNEEMISAKYEDGILHVILPKDEKKILKKTIEVR
jgi:HSP20 family protein